MSKIKILSEQTANQIAAGEVVERPASVVKELVENAIDAGARQVAVQVEGSGTRLIRILDDGEGMDQDDALLCLERHATSKLHGDAQLAAIRSLGFRGEALPSIASVSHLIVTSRPAAAELGTRVEVRFGKVLKVHEMGCSRGTCMEVRDLFGNVPARRKFLKTARTELFHIEEAVRSYALACPALGLSYMVDGREVLQLPARAETLEQRLRSLLGCGPAAPLIGLEMSAEGGGQIGGFLLPPEEAGAAARLAVFVNGRPVRDRLLAHAVVEGLRGFLPAGKRPAGVLTLDLAPGEVDVNVHPTKQEVRFRQATSVHRQVAAAVESGLAAYERHLKKTLFVLPARAEEQPLAAVDSRLKESGQPSLPAGRTCEPSPAAAWPPSGMPIIALPEKRSLEAGEESGMASDRQPDDLQVEEASPAGLVPAPGRGLAPRYLGQAANTYLLCEADRGLLVIDQHALHERLLFEELKEQYHQRRVIRQTLLFPKLLTFRSEESEIVVQHGAEIERLGIELQDFGGGSYILKAIPAILGRLPPEEVVAGILAQFAGREGEARRPAGRSDTILANMACKAAIKAGQPLSAAEAEHLLRQVEDAGVFTHCPHGRPAMKFFAEQALKKWFQRT